MNRKFRVFGLNYDDITLDEAAKKMEAFIQDGKPSMIFTTGAEPIVKSSWNKDLKQIYLDADLLTVDSYVVYFACRMIRKPIREPVSAVNLMFRFLERTIDKKYRLFFLGARDQILNEAMNNLQNRFPGINIVGWHHGYFNFDQDSEIVNKIIQAKPDVLFVAMSTPLKESFISKNIKKINVPVAIGVGGSIDVASGLCQLAPRWMSRIGLEWFYRFIQEPRRLWKRYIITNFVFIWLVIKELFRKR